MNSSPSYFKSEIYKSSKSTSPLILKAVMYDAVFPSNSSVRSATITLSSEDGINLKVEKPLVFVDEKILNKFTKYQ